MGLSIVDEGQLAQQADLLREGAGLRSTHRGARADWASADAESSGRSFHTSR